jgi:hypothetical protein
MDIKDFLFRHVEKFIFGTLVLLAVLLVYRGFQMPDYLAQQQPDRMEQAAKEVRVAIDADHWEEIAEPRLVSIDVVSRTNESMRPVDPQGYPLTPWEAKSIDMGVRRADPAIPAPVELLVSGVISGIAYKSADPEYALKKLEPAEAIEKAPEPRQRERRPRNRRQQMMDPYGEMSYDESYTEPDYGYEMSGMAAVTPGRRLDAKYDQGFRPQGNMAELVPGMGHFIAGVALMPHKQLHLAFEEALHQADGPDPRRDRPRYEVFQVSRADVTDKPVEQLTDQDWVNRGYSTTFQRQVLPYWAGMAKEIVTGRYRDPMLTMPIPPVLLTHYTRFASHPKIPLGDEDPLATQRQSRPTLPEGPMTLDVDEDPFAGQDRGRRRMPPGMGGYGDGEAEMMDYGMSYGAAAGGMFAMMSSANEPDHKLIRFYDFRDLPGGPQPGRRYVYRVRIGIEDPNFPRDERAQPRDSTLSVDVFRRVQQEKAKATQANRRNFIRFSDWSAPSPMVSLPPTNQAYAGPVTPPATRKMQVQGREIEFVQKPPVGKLVVAQWDRTYQAPVPVFMDVLRGTLVTKTGELEVPDPLALVVKKLPPETKVNTQTVVLDLGGGHPLSINQAENQTEPGMMLLFDPEGGLRVVDEVDSQHRYRMYSFADERGE